MIDDETILDGLWIIILTDHELSATLVADALNLRRKSLDMITSLALGTSTTTGDAVSDNLVRNVDENDGLDRRTDLIERLGLGDVTRKAIEEHL